MGRGARQNILRARSARRQEESSRGACYSPLLGVRHSGNQVRFSGGLQGRQSYGSILSRAPLTIHNQTMVPSMRDVSILLVAVLCASIPAIFAQLQFPGANVLNHGDLGFSIVLPLSRNPSNHTLAFRETTRLSRVLADGAEPNAKMRLYDDLLTKGYYTSRLWIGSPPQEFALIVDTGSTVTYVPCSSCGQCGTHQDPRFKPENSSTYRPMKCGPGCSSCNTEKQQCTYERRYAEQSTSKGLLGDDLISFGNEVTLGPERLVFGCETAETGDIYDQKADGIMGLGRGPLSIVDQLVEQKAMTASFSLCYGGMDEGGGAMIMGAIPQLHEMVFTTSDFTRSAYYNLALQEVFVGGTALPLDKGVFDSNFGTVLDSGTTYAYFPDKAFEAFKTALIQHVKLHKVAGPDSHYPDICFEGAGSDLSKLSDHFPEVQLKFGDGKIISLAPENYLFKHIRVQGAYCLGVFANGKNSATLLGGIVVRNMLVTYDRVNQQIGFWRTNCSDLWRNLQAALVPPGSPGSAGSPVPPPVAAPDGSVESNVIPGLTCVSGNLDITVVLNTRHSDSNSFKEKFLKDLSDDLKVDRSQVNLLDFADDGENVTAAVTVHLAATNEHLLQIAAETIIAHLKSEDLPLHDSYGPYVVTYWNLTIIKQRPSNEPRLWVLVSIFTLFVFVIMAGIGSLVWWYLWRFRGQKYVSIQESIQLTEQI